MASKLKSNPPNFSTTKVFYQTVGEIVSDNEESNAKRKGKALGNYIPHLKLLYSKQQQATIIKILNYQVQLQ